MRESEIEKYLVRVVKMYGGEVRKVKWIGRRSAPDRLVLLPEIDTHGPAGVIPAARIWVELKATGKKATAAQVREHDRLRKFNERVEVIDSFDGVIDLFR